MSEDELRALEARFPEGEASEAVRTLAALLRQLQRENAHLKEQLAAAPTQEQLHALVSQLKETRGELAVARAHAARG